MYKVSCYDIIPSISLEEYCKFLCEKGVIEERAVYFKKQINGVIVYGLSMTKEVS